MLVWLVGAAQKRVSCLLLETCTALTARKQCNDENEEEEEELKLELEGERELQEEEK